MDVTDNISQLNGFLGNTLVAVSIVQMFFMCFPRSYLKDVIIYQKNYRLDEPLTLGEIIMWIGIWFLLTTMAENS